MLDFSQIRREFIPELKGITAFRAMIKEFLQCKVLEFIYRGPFADRLIFLGGTKLRLMNNFRRFSEDLDFDLNGDYNSSDHLALCDYLCDSFNRQNIRAEIDQDKKIREEEVYTRFINFPSAIEKSGLRDVQGRKFYLKIDAQRHDYGSYSTSVENLILNRFDVFVPVACAPDSMILATKLISILERSKGRDYYDIVELVRTTKTDLDYLARRMKYGRIQKEYKGPDSYVDLLLPALSAVDWKDKVKEIEKFLFHQEETKKVEEFASFATEKEVRRWLSQESE